MLSSLFGELTPAGRRRSGDGDDAEQGFAATAILETVATEVNERGQMVDRHLRDLVVTGSPAQAIREHFASTRADLDTASRMITLLDPQSIWASSVVKALSDAGGQPIERIHLREQITLKTIAMIERTTLIRRHEDPLKIVHADVRAPGKDASEIPVALMERSHMTTVIVGAMQPHTVDDLLESLRNACSLPTWRCPNLLFMLPPGAVWIANKIAVALWPSRVHVHVVTEPLTSASSVWNAMLGMWNHVKSQPSWEPTPQPAAQLGVSDFPIKVADLAGNTAPRPATAAAAASTQPAIVRVSRGTIDAARARQALADMLTLDGLLGCAIVDSTTGLVLAREMREDQPVDLELAAGACAQVLRAHRQAARSMGLSEQIDEIMTSSGPRQQVMRTISRYPDLFLVALLDKQRTNLALTRYKLMEVERGLL